MQASKKFRLFTRITVVACLAFLILLTGFETLPLSHYGTNYLNNADTQRVRSQVLLKSALTLEYRPASEHPQAISDMQVALPLFIQEQNILAQNPNVDIQQKVQAANPDYQAMIAAAQRIITTPSGKPVDPVQVDILIGHNRDFLIEETAVITVIAVDEENEQILLFFVEFILDLILFFLGIGFLVVFELVNKKPMGTNQ